MRSTAIVVAVFVALVVAFPRGNGQAAPSSCVQERAALRADVADRRALVWRAQQELGLARTRAARLAPAASCAYLRWVARLWTRRAVELRGLEERLADPRAAIRHVFGPYARQALDVARCESGYRTSAVNGQYLGLFQMGRWERATYGHGETPLAQARAAFRYFAASGHDWSPWSCKPS